MRFLHFAYEAHTQKKTKAPKHESQKNQENWEQALLFFVFSSNISSFSLQPKLQNATEHTRVTVRHKPSESPHFHFYQQVRDLGLSLQPQQITAKKKTKSSRFFIKPAQTSVRLQQDVQIFTAFLSRDQSGVCDSGPDICQYDPREK